MPSLFTDNVIRQMNPPENHKLFAILGALREAGIFHSLDVVRDGAVTLFAVVPGQRWEIDVFVDGTVEIEVFESRGDIVDEDRLQEMIRKHSESKDSP